MVRRCIAAGCSNTPTGTINLFKFPKDPVLRVNWVRQDRRTRAQWEATEHSILYSEHFTEDCFEVNAAIPQNLACRSGGGSKKVQSPRYSREGPQNERRHRAKDRVIRIPTAPPKHPCGAVEKRDRVRVSNCTCCHASISIYMYTNDCLLVIILLQIVEELLSQPSTSAAVTVQECEDLPSSVSTSTQTQPSSIGTQTCTFMG